MSKKTVASKSHEDDDRIDTEDSPADSGNTPAERWVTMLAAKVQMPIVMARAIGAAFASNEHVPEDLPEAVEWWQAAAKQGIPDAQVAIGYCYQQGQGVGQDFSKAATWYRKAAEQAHAWAQFALGLCYQEGIGVDLDKLVAIEWYRKAAEQGNPFAQYTLGIYYLNGDGVEQDFSEAAKWYRKAAEQGDPDAQYAIAVCYDEGKGVKQSFATAAKWYRKAADQGNPEAQRALGYCYKHGEGVEQDLAEGVRWYRMAADQGDIEALMNLGVCYEQGQGVAQNASRAVKLFTQVAKQGHPVAQFNLARCYFKGEGIAQDKSKAVKWCRKAAEQGFTEAQFVLGGQLLIRDETVPDNVAEANVAEGVMWLRKAAEQGHAGAQNTLGKCYDHGVCVPEDRSEAAKWLKKAAEQGLAAAQEYLNNDEEYNEMEEALIAGFLKQLADDDDKVCEAAYNSLVRRGSRVLPSLFNSLGDLDWQVAKMSVKAIVEIDSDQLPHLLNHIGELLPDDLEELTLENRQRAGFHYAMRGQLYELIENLDDAVRDYTAATKCDPRLETGNWFLLARAQESNGDERLRQAIEAYGEGQSLANGGQYAKAAEQYQLAMKVCSSFPWGFNDLAWLLATCSETSLRDGRQAVELAKKAVALGHKNDWSLWDTLAAAFAESGQYPEAVKAMQQAQKIAPEGAKREIAFNLRRYQSGLPWSAMESGD